MRKATNVKEQQRVTEMIAYDSLPGDTSPTESQLARTNIKSFAASNPLAVCHKRGLRELKAAMPL